MLNTPLAHLEQLRQTEVKLGEMHIKVTIVVS